MINCRNHLDTGYYRSAQCKTFICISSFNPQLSEVATIVILILYRRKLTFREAKLLAQGHVASKMQSKGLEPGSSRIQSSCSSPHWTTLLCVNLRIFSLTK